MTDPNKTSETDFGYERVPWGEKQRRVRGVFDSVAENYDLMNDLMSGGAHRLWKEFTLSLTGLHAGQRALDVAGGTGDLTTGLAKQVGKSGVVILSDINGAMLNEGRDRLIDAGLVGNVGCVLANAESLPFADSQFDCVTIGFGLRNVTDKPAALREMRRVLKPGGQLLVLEFSHPVLPFLKPLYDVYSFRVLPLIGKLVAKGRGQLSLSRRVDSHASGPGETARHAARVRARRLSVSQSHRRHRGGAPGLSLLRGTDSPMGPLFSAYVLAMLLGIVFIPLFVIALAMLRSASRAFVLASTFTMGAMIGFFLGVLAGSWLLETHAEQTGSLVLLFTFAAASAVAGGVIAIWLLGKLSGNSPWRRD